MSNIIRFNEASNNSEWLVMSNQGTDCFLDLLISAADDLDKTEHQKELVSFLEDRRSINDIAPGTADFDIIDMPWEEDCLIDDIQFVFQAMEAAQTETVFAELPYEVNKEIVLPWLEKFASMIEQMLKERD